jgi:hypothetical protein
MGHSHRLSKKLHSLLDSYGPEIATPDPRAKPPCIALHADAPPQVIQEEGDDRVLAQMPSDTMIFITAAVLGLAATLIGLRWLIQAAAGRRLRRVYVRARIFTFRLRLSKD